MRSAAITLPGSSNTIDKNISAAGRDGITTAMWNSLITFSSCCGHVRYSLILKIYHSMFRSLHAAGEYAAQGVSPEQTLSHDLGHLGYLHSDRMQI
jgi:hypothetical protein